MISINTEVNPDHQTVGNHHRPGNAVPELHLRGHEAQSEQREHAEGENDTPSSPRQAITLRSAAASAVLAGAVCLALSYIGGVSHRTPAAPRSAPSKLIRLHLVYALSSSSHSLPRDVAALKYSKPAQGSGAIDIVSPSWKPYPDSSGTVQRGGDIAVVDDYTVTVNLNLQLEVENLQSLTVNYKSFTFPVDIYRCDPGIGPCGTQANPWTAFKTAGTELFVSNTSPVVTTSLEHGYVYDLTMDPKQGHYQTTKMKNPKSGALSPAFLITTVAHAPAN